MIKLILEIEEMEKMKKEGIVSSIVEINFQEIGKNATHGERETLDILKKRLKLEDKIQFEDLTKEKKIERILKELF